MYSKKRAEAFFSPASVGEIVESCRKEKSVAPERLGVDASFGAAPGPCEESACEGELNNSYRSYPWYVLFKGGMNAIATISKNLSDLQRDDQANGMNGTHVLTPLLFNINTNFFYNTEMNLKNVRSFLLYQRAIRRKNAKDYKNASIDCNEALNYNPCIRECYLLKARIDNLKDDSYKVVECGWRDV